MRQSDLLENEKGKTRLSYTYDSGFKTLELADCRPVTEELEIEA